jgi:F-type H+-transporting ATPase subunit b
MPQIAQLSQTYASQIFWILIIFGFVFFAIGRGMVPKVMATVETRDRQISNDLAAAESARKAADAEEEAWKVHHNQQRAEVQAILAKAKADAGRATESRLHDASVTLDAKLECADKRIAAARDGALGEIETVASEAASDIVARLAGVSVSPDAARAAVKEAFHG